MTISESSLKGVSDGGIPPMGLGIFGRTGEEGLRAILAGLEIGYRHIDTAQSYDTEGVVGQALSQSGLTRSDVFITTKVAMRNLSRERFLPSLRDSLDRLRTDRDGVDAPTALVCHSGGVLIIT
jgi:2,5-diketo-D-gluconate reductase B